MAFNFVNPFAQSPIFSSTATPGQTANPQTPDVARTPEVLCGIFNKINVDGASDFFNFMIHTQPNTINQCETTHVTKIIDCKTRFNARHEQDFLRQVGMYNQWPAAKNKVEVKKETDNPFYFGDVVYMIRVMTK